MSRSPHGRWCAIVVWCLLMLFQQQTSAQPLNAQTNFRLAQSYEQAGQYERALQLYQSLHRSEPGNIVYFEGVRRVLLQLKRYDECIVLLRQRLVLLPSDPTLFIHLGNVQYKAGLEKEAFASWEQAIGIDKKNQNIYRLVANAMLENRLMEQTIEMYRRARTEINDPNLFTVDIAYLLGVSMDYAGSTREYVQWLMNNPGQLAYVQARMSQFTGKEEARTAAIGVVKVAMEGSDHPKLLELLGWLLMEEKDFGAALDVYRRIDRSSNNRGASLYGFADRAYRDKAYEVAARAYHDVITLPAGGAMLSAARYGFANCLMHLSAMNVARIPDLPDEWSTPTQESTIAYFRRIITEHPRTEYSARSYLQIGVLLYEQSFDLDGSLASFELAEKEMTGNALIRHDAALQIGEILVVKGDTARARARFMPVSIAADATPDQNDEAGFRLAEISYFGDDFKGATERLAEISFNVKADYANDALALQSFLEENEMTDPKALGEFARGEFLARQRKTVEAIATLKSIVTRHPQALLIDDAWMTIAQLQTRIGQFQDAVASYRTLLTDFKETSIALDRALFNMAEIMEQKLQSPLEAAAAYEKILVEHPKSLLCTEARKRIRAIRGDNL